jgi:hypothetical protein
LKKNQKKTEKIGIFEIFLKMAQLTVDSDIQDHELHLFEVENERRVWHQAVDREKRLNSDLAGLDSEIAELEKQVNIFDEHGPIVFEKYIRRVSFHIIKKTTSFSHHHWQSGSTTAPHANQNEKSANHDGNQSLPTYNHPELIQSCSSQLENRISPKQTKHCSKIS